MFKTFDKDYDLMKALSSSPSTSSTSSSNTFKFENTTGSPSTQYFTPQSYTTSIGADVHNRDNEWGISKESCGCDSSPDLDTSNISVSNNGMKKKLNGILDSFMNLFKNIVGAKDIYKAVSLYEFYFTLLFIVLIASLQNTYLAILLLGLLSRRIPEKLIKMLLSRSEGKLRNWAQRPQGASDCNMFNSGGDYSDDSGLVSSHTFLISSLIFYLIFRFTQNFKYSMNTKQYTFVGLLVLWMGLVALARVRLGCHNSTQTIIGIILGVGWGYLLYYILETIKESVPRIKEDEIKALSIFENEQTVLIQ